MDYQINISISSKGLDTIYESGLSVTLVKEVLSNPVNPGNQPVAWIAFEPLQLNKVTWSEQFRMYATTTILQAGAQIVMTSQTDTPIQGGWTYTFARGQFTGAEGGDAASFGLVNASSGKYNFGLAQQASVNNVQVFSPLNAVPVPPNLRASFQPLEKVSLFLSSYNNNGSVITQVASNALAITLTMGNPVANVAFNDKTNTFYLQKPSLKTPSQFVQQLTQAQLSEEFVQTGLYIA